MLNIKSTGLKSEEFAYALLEKEQVAVVPGITYGDCCEDFIRIAFTLDIYKIKEGIQRLKRILSKVYKNEKSFNARRLTLYQVYD